METIESGKQTEEHAQPNQVTQQIQQTNGSVRFIRMKECSLLLENALESNEPAENIYQPLQQLREIISYDEDIPFDEFVDLGLKFPLKSILERYTKHSRLIAECLWIFTNITTVSTEKFKTIIDDSFIKAVLKYISHHDVAVNEHVIHLSIMIS